MEWTRATREEAQQIKITCADCHQPYGLGDWPWCPHEKVPKDHWFFKPYVDQHIADDPVEITSPGHRREIMKENKIEFHSPKVGEPGCEV